MQRNQRNTQDEFDEEFDIPLHRKRPFGAGIKRKQIEFVRARDPDAGLSTATTSTATLVGDLYTTIVLKSDTENKDAKTSEEEAKEAAQICPDCGLDVSSTTQPHEAALAHQVSLRHTMPPSALDRSRMGVRTLTSQGWDMDAHEGLGREREGIRHPIKVKEKNNKLGIGAATPKTQEKKKEHMPYPINKKELKRHRAKERQRHERLQHEIYGRVDVESYLRGDGSDEVSRNNNKKKMDQDKSKGDRIHFARHLL
ncbi:hypothetical protein FPSE_04289 [Fusarium pseudograminearum CS3096]|uniref:G-patch domain-containing protein n=1 Tax=Fusarium pseudograminearum (strain CS3096) TaxID=1028729 RepID=K3VLL5_FUSPC|nr:hypothetical protein FPSE_04289 [Fusarium pseudograminearum CS3096]EKJ75514.1 hypothetical protein FPSE_04289 [Fusarium pseudograminearum CS3096]KAF0643892.1 hypothetical protein FPSE5266_04289 [Fusarium pseudograminearum]